MATAGAGSRKGSRQARILQLVAGRSVDTQEELAEHLQREGFHVTQATVSRDIRELRLVKVPAGDGRYRYAVAEGGAQPTLPNEFMLRLFRECVLGFDHSENLVVISTQAGTAQSVAEVVDRLHAPEVIGTLAGERTVFVVIKPRRAVPAFLERLRTLMGSQGQG